MKLMSGNSNLPLVSAIAAYLEGFELIESALDNLDAPLRAETEREVLPAVEQAVEGERPCGGRGLLAEPERQEHLVANGGGGRKSHQHSSGGSGQNRGDSA